MAKKIKVYINKDETYPDYSYKRKKSKTDWFVEGPFLFTRAQLAFIDEAMEMYSEAQRMLAAPIEALEAAYQKREEAKNARAERTAKRGRLSNKEVL